MIVLDLGEQDQVRELQRTKTKIIVYLNIENHCRDDTKKIEIHRFYSLLQNTCLQAQIPPQFLPLLFHYLHIVAKIPTLHC